MQPADEGTVALILHLEQRCESVGHRPDTDGLNHISFVAALLSDLRLVIVEATAGQKWSSSFSESEEVLLGILCLKWRLLLLIKRMLEIICLLRDAGSGRRRQRHAGTPESD